MNKNSKRLGFFILIISAVTLAAVVLRTVALINDFDLNTGYFKNNVIIAISAALIVGAAVLGAIFALSMKKTSLRASFDSPHTYVPTGALAVSLLFLIFNLIVTADIPAMIAGGGFGITNMLAIAAAILGVLAIVHLFMTAFYPVAQVKKRAYFAIFAILFYAIFAT